MAGYVYQGSHTGLDLFDLPQPVRRKPGGGRKRGSGNLKPCGTRAAYQRHKQHGEPACSPCIEANRQYQRDENAQKMGKQ